jgi:gamma-glutamyltranspeptidase/glutathione hydrolase
LKKTKVAITSGSQYTVDAGARLAELGGNAVDIAVGAALAATVSEALMCSLGGSAFLNIKLPNQDAVLIDGADAMPSVPNFQGSLPDSWKTAHVPYGDGININVGHSSIAVPGMLRSVECAWKKYGSLPWSEVVAPAYEIAKSGVKANKTLDLWLGMAGEAVYKEQKTSRESFFKDDKPLVEGDLNKIDKLDDSFDYIAREGAKAFYEGDLGAMFSAEVLGNGGFVTREDLTDYTALSREPLIISSRDHKLAFNPPPAIGGAMIASMIHLYEDLWTPKMSDAEKMLKIAQVQQTILSLRAQENNSNWSRARAEKIIAHDWLKKFFHKVFSPNTMHLSVATEDGSVVSITMSNGYGSGISIPGTGIACNNSLGEPELNPSGFFEIKKGERLVSNMSPTVAWKSDGTTLAMGSPGASRITTTIFQSWLRFAFEGYSFEDTVRAPRLHLEPMDGELILQHEPGIDTELLSQHYKLRAFDEKNMYFGSLNLAGHDSKGNLHALGDSRRFGRQIILG